MMTPYYKLPKDWANTNQNFIIFGPNGLTKHSLVQTIIKTYKNHPLSRLKIHDKNDIESLKASLISNSLFDEKQAFIIDLTQTDLKNFPWNIGKKADRIIVLIAPEKPPKDTKHIQQFGACIRTYALKEPHRSRAVQACAAEHQIAISSRAARWVSMCHHGDEACIPQTIKKLRLIYGGQKLTDDDVKACLRNNASLNIFEAIEAMGSNSTHLQIFLKNHPKAEWQKTYWALVSYWRKILLCSNDPSLMKHHFPWEQQSTQAKKFLTQLNTETIQNYHSELLSIERHTKGIGTEPYLHLISQWMLSVSHQILKG